MRPFRLTSAPPSSRPALVAFACLVLAAACGRSAPTPAPTATPSPPAAVDAAPAEPPPPDLGLPREGYLDARRLQLCAEKFQVAPAEAEHLALTLLAGDPTAVQAPAQPTEATVAASQPAASPADPALQDRYRKAHPIAAGHAPTQAWVDAEVAGCVYDAEAGLIPRADVERYAVTFAEVACLQREILGPDGKTDPVAHARAATEVFKRAGYTAARFAQLGLVLARHPVAQKLLFAKKRARCPAAAPASAPVDRRSP